jgi:maleylacetoacetate isomerase
MATGVVLRLIVCGNFFIFIFRIALYSKNIEFKNHPINLVKKEQVSEEYLKIQPQGLVPALQFDGKTLGQSLAILQWLEDLYPDVPLLPSDPWLKAVCMQMALLIACEIHPVQNLKILDRITQLTEGKPGMREEWARTVMVDGFKALEILLKEHMGTCCVGNQVTWADICLIPQVYNARRFKVDMTAFPLIEKVCLYLETLPAFQKAHPSQQPDAQI